MIKQQKILIEKINKKIAKRAKKFTLKISSDNFVADTFPQQTLFSGTDEITVKLS